MHSSHQGLRAPDIFLVSRLMGSAEDARSNLLWRNARMLAHPSPSAWTYETSTRCILSCCPSCAFCSSSWPKHLLDALLAICATELRAVSDRVLIGQRVFWPTGCKFPSAGAVIVKLELTRWTRSCSVVAETQLQILWKDFHI